MNRRATGGIPSGRAIVRKLTDLGTASKGEYFRLRDKYKGEGLSAREAIERACVELRVMERWEVWRLEQAGMVMGLEREGLSGALGSGVAATEGEVREGLGGYVGTGSVVRGEVGKEEMSLGEQVAWAKRWVARIQNGDEGPKKFPNEGALFWLQSALSNRREFEKVVLRVESPVVEGESAYLLDGQYQLREIEKQLEAALLECGERLVEMEGGFVELLKGICGAEARE